MSETSPSMSLGSSTLPVAATRAAMLAKPSATDYSNNPESFCALIVAAQRITHSYKEKKRKDVDTSRMGY